MAQFILFEQDFSIPDSYIRNYEMDNISHRVAMKAKADFFSWYKKCSGIEDVLRNYTDFAIGLVVEYAFTPLFDTLQSFDIYDINSDRYISQCVDCSKIDDSFELILSELEEIVDSQEEMRQYRAARKAHRGRMVGGGFGISGAIKGAVQAGAINATTGLAHSTVNAIGNMGSAIAASSKKTALYNDENTKNFLVLGIYLSIMNTYANHKELINRYIRNYYEDGFDKEKAGTLFENAKKYSDKRERLLFESVINYPAEETLSYIFIHYQSERKNVYQIGKTFGIDLGKYVEEAFAISYTDEIKLNEQSVEEVKNEIISTMKEFGIKSSATLDRINFDELARIAKKYLAGTEDTSIQQILDSFEGYDAPISQKQQVVQEKGIWQLASKYSVTYAVDEIESILKRYYTEDAQKNEADAQDAKRKLLEIMSVLNVQTSVTYDQLEKDCIARICENLEDADEERCNQIRDKITHYDALEKNKIDFFEQIQKRIESIWTKEDGEIFDNVYLNTDIYNQEEINCAIEFIEQKGRTSNAKRYIAALQACNEKNIRNAQKFQEKGTKTSNTIGTILLVIGIVCLFLIPPCVVIALPGLVLKIRYSKLKQNWNILTIDGEQIHSSIMITNSVYTKDELNECAVLTEETTSGVLDEEKMYCVFCGKQIKRTVKFCNYCGEKVRVEEDKNNDM